MEEEATRGGTVEAPVRAFDFSLICGRTPSRHLLGNSTSVETTNVQLIHIRKASRISLATTNQKMEERRRVDMTRERFRTRCIPISLVVLIAVCAFLIATTGQAASGPSPGAAYSSNGVSASIRAVQPAVSGLFQVHAPRAWVDALDESGVAGANGVADFLDSWDAFRARASSAILKNSYAFTTVDGLGHEVLYAGVQRASSGGPSSVVLEFNQKAGERLPGDLRISAEIDAAGSLGTVSFESYAGSAKGIARFLPVAILSGEGCNDAGTACVVANGPLLEVGYNLTALGKPEKEFSGIQIRTPEDQASGTIRIMSAFASVSGGCIKEVGGVNNPVCTANDVRLASVKDVVILPGDTCNPNNPNDTITIQSFTGIFTSGPQRYDIGSYVATDGGGVDGARSGSCTRVAFQNNTTGLTNLDNDSCADIAANQTVEIPLGPITIKCVDAFEVGADGNPVAGNDGNIDFFHCETWAQQANEIICDDSEDVKSGTPSKCGCSLTGAAAGFCVPIDDGNACTTEVCQGNCQTATGQPGATCSSNAECTGAGETCRGIEVRSIPVENGTSCGADPDTSNPCDLAPTCQAGSCTANFAGNTTECRASAGDCDLPESCDGTTNDCPADGFQTNAVQCRAAAGACDVAESCSGSSATCPADSKSSAQCRASAGDCDVPESCNGTSNDCPANGFQTNAVLCRAAAGDCDVAENCTGAAATCPDDAVQPNTYQCRGSDGSPCDPAEFCNGVGKSCGPDVCAGGERDPNIPKNICDAN
jgi:hypothetical protein